MVAAAVAVVQVEAADSKSNLRLLWASVPRVVKSQQRRSDLYLKTFFDSQLLDSMAALQRAACGTKIANDEFALELFDHTMFA